MGARFNLVEAQHDLARGHAMKVARQLADPGQPSASHLRRTTATFATAAYTGWAQEHPRRPLHQHICKSDWLASYPPFPHQLVTHTTKPNRDIRENKYNTHTPQSEPLTLGCLDERTKADFALLSHSTMSSSSTPASSSSKANQKRKGKLSRRAAHSHSLTDSLASLRCLSPDKSRTVEEPEQQGAYTHTLTLKT